MTEPHDAYSNSPQVPRPEPVPGSAAPVPPTPPKTSWWRRTLRGVLIFVFLGSLLMNFWLMAILGMLVEDSPLQAKAGEWIGSAPEDSSPEAPLLAVIPLRGIVSGVGDEAAQDMVAWARTALRTAQESERVKGILLEVDSPGGTVHASDLIHHLVKQADAKKPVQVLMGSVCASGGYYIACSARKVWASPTTVTGSIGVILSVPKVGDFLERHGVHMQTYTSGPNKEMLSPFREDTTEQSRLVQGMVDDMYGRFLDVVVQGRGLPVEKARALADGRVYTADGAVREGLVDGVAYSSEVLDQFRRDLGLEGVRIVNYQPRRGLLRGLLAARGPADPISAWVDRMGLAEGPAVLYLWRGF